MKNLELSIFKRLALSIIGIIIIPIILFISHEVLSKSQNQLEGKREESVRNMNLIYEKLVDTYSRVESIQLIISRDIQFLDFLTNEQGHTPVEYTIFERENLKNYQKLLSVSKEIQKFKLYVDNQNMLEMYPYISNKIPKDKFLKDQAKIIIKNGEPYLYYFKNIYFYPQSVYLEMEVNLTKIFNEQLADYYLIDNEKVVNSNNEEEVDLIPILKKIDLSDFKKIKLFREKEELYIFQSLPFTDVKLLNIIHQKSIIDIKYLGYLLFIAFFTLTVIYTISYLISKKIFKQLDFIFEAVNKIKKGNLNISFPHKFEHAEFSELANQLISMSKNIDRLIDENIENQKLVNDFQIKALQSQINSHFLQNSLEGIKMMAYINEDYEVSNSLLSLGKILRYGMDWKNPIVSIGDEVEYLKQYIKLFSIRTENSITFRIYIEEELKNIKIPKMILQPLVENSILHGIIPKETAGFIQGRIYKNNGNLVFDILDNGKGTKINEINENQQGIGIYNVKQRFRLFFNKKVEFKVTSRENEFTRVQIIIEGCENYEKDINC